MKILLIHNFFQQFGGEDVVTLAEKKMLEEHSEQVFLYSRHNEEIKQYGSRQKLAAAVDTLYSRKTSRDIRSIVDRFGPDVAYIQNVYPLISPSVYHTLHSLAVPTFQYVHDFRFLCPNGWFFTDGEICERCKLGNCLHAALHKCYRNSYPLSALYGASVGINRAAHVMKKLTGLICMTEFSRQKFLEAGVPGEKLFIKPNFIDASTIAAHPGKGNYVLFIGRLSPEKGLWTLVRAFECLPKVPLYIAGIGPLAGALRDYLHRKQLHHINLVGFKAGREKVEMLQNCLFTVLPSEWYENFPTTVLESFAAGKPVVASNLGSLPFIVEHEKSGLLFAPGDPADLRGKVAHLFANRVQVERMGKFSRNLTETRYSTDESYRIFIRIVSHAGRVS